MKYRKSFLVGLAIVVSATAILLTSCEPAAQIASRNVSQAADHFEINRRIIFYNGITDTYMLVVEGWCSLGIGTNKLTVTCRVGEEAYKKHYLGLSDNVTYFAEQLESANVSEYHHKIIFKPQNILPDIEIRGDASKLPIVGSD